MIVMKTLVKNSCLFILPLLFSFSLLLHTPAYAQNQQTIQVPVSELLILQENNSKLVLKLQELELQMSVLEKPTSELQEQLQTAREQLKKSQQELTASNLKLKNVENLQKETLQSLIALSEELEQLRKQEAETKARIRRQRDLGYLVAALAIIYAART